MRYVYINSFFVCQTYFNKICTSILTDELQSSFMSRSLLNLSKIVAVFD